MASINPLAQLLGIRPSQGQVEAPRPVRLTGGYDMQANKSADLYNMQGALNDETADRAFQEERLGGQGNPAELKALKNLFNRRQDDMRNGVVGQQAPIQAQNEADLYAATQAGFSGPNPVQAQNVYQRGIAEEKMRQPMALEAARGANTIAHDRVVGQNQLDVSEQQGQNSLNLQDRINENARIYMQGSANNRAYNPKTGAVGADPSARQTPPNLNPLMMDYTKQLQSLRGADIFDQNFVNRPGVREARQAWVNILQQHPADAEVKQEVMEFLQDPKYKGRPFEDVYHPDDFPDPQDFATLNELVRLARGGQ